MFEVRYNIGVTFSVSGGSGFGEDRAAACVGVEDVWSALSIKRKRLIRAEGKVFFVVVVEDKVGDGCYADCFCSVVILVFCQVCVSVADKRECSVMHFICERVGVDDVSFSAFHLARGEVDHTVVEVVALVCAWDTERSKDLKQRTEVE